MAWKKLCNFSDLSENQGQYVELDQLQLAVFLKEGKIHCVQNTCPHAGGSLAGGYLEDDMVVCPWHYWSFKLSDGSMPGSERVKIKVYPTRLAVNGQTVEIDLPDPAQQ